MYSGGAGVGNLGALESLVFKNCAWLGDVGPNRPPWCPTLTGLSSLTELVFDHCPMLSTLPDSVRRLNTLILLDMNNTKICEHMVWQRTWQRLSTV